MTRTQFDNLPLLLSPGQAARVIQCNRETLRILREQNPTIAVRLKGMKHPRYLKFKLAEIAGIDVSSH
jgi:hypothetical protein